MGSTQNLAHNELGIFIWFNQLKVKMMVCSMFVLISKICDLKHFCGRQYMTNLTLFKIFENLFQFSSKLFFRNGAVSCHFNNFYT